MKQRFVTALLVAGLFAAPVSAQFWDSVLNPDVQVTLTHPPGLGIKVQRVAFAPVTSRAAEDLVSACIADLAATGQMEVLDRGNIEKVLNEQKFGQSGLVDEKTAVELGRLLGSTVLIFTSVQRMEVKHIPLNSTQPGWTDKKNVSHPAVTTFVAKTQVELTASIQAVDLATGRIHSQQRIAVAPSEQNSSSQGAPEYPADTAVIEQAVGLVRLQVHQMLLPWTERRKLIFYDDKDYGMKEAYKRLQLNDPAEALQKSLAALEAARADTGVKAKYLGRTNYNVGMCHFIRGDYQAALPYLKAARETDPSHKIFAGAEAECLKGLQLAEEMSRVDARSDKAGPRLEPQGAKAAGATPEDLELRLQKLDNLRKKGLITGQDYEAKKAEILKDL